MVVRVAVAQVDLEVAVDLAVLVVVARVGLAVAAKAVQVDLVEMAQVVVGVAVQAVVVLGVQEVAVVVLGVVAQAVQAVLGVVAQAVLVVQADLEVVQVVVVLPTTLLIQPAPTAETLIYTVVLPIDFLLGWRQYLETTTILVRSAGQFRQLARKICHAFCLKCLERKKLATFFQEPYCGLWSVLAQNSVIISVIKWLKSKPQIFLIMQTLSLEHKRQQTRLSFGEHKRNSGRKISAIFRKWSAPSTICVNGQLLTRLFMQNIRVFLTS